MNYLHIYFGIMYCTYNVQLYRMGNFGDFRMFQCLLSFSYHVMSLPFASYPEVILKTVVRHLTKFTPCRLRKYQRITEDRKTPDVQFPYLCGKNVTELGLYYILLSRSIVYIIYSPYFCILYIFVIVNKILFN